MSIINQLRRPKFFNMAIFDFLMTFLVAILIWKYFDYKSYSELFLIFLFLIIIAIVVHWITNTPTMLNYYLGINSYEAVIKSREIM
jgi:hypothetical protein